MPCSIDLVAARRLGTVLASTGRLLARAGFSERAVTAWYGVPLVSDARWVPIPPPGERPRRGLGALVALLVAGEAVERRALTLLDGTHLAALVAVGIVELDGDLVRARASVVPLRDVLVVADRLDESGPGAVLSPDLSAWSFAACLPAGAPSLLDVGCGAGAACLVAARRGARVVGTDIDGRAIELACVGALLADVPAMFVEGDLYAHVDGRFDVVAFNAPLLRAPLLAEGAPLYLRSPRGEALVTGFLDGARERLAPGGEVLCHTQLSPAVAAAARRTGLERRLALHFGDAIDGTPHALLRLAAGAPGYDARVRVPLGPALPHLRRELVDRLDATLPLAAMPHAGSDDDAAADGAAPGPPTAARFVTLPSVAGTDALAAAVVRPAPWLLLERTARYDGASFRERDVRFGGRRLEPADLALLEACDGRPLGEVTDDLARARVLVAAGLLVA